MKSMMISELLIARKYLVQQLLLGFIVGLFISIATGSIFTIPPIITFMFPFSLAFTLIAFDERGNWEQFRLILPLSRADVIRGRYLSFASFVCLGLLAGLLSLGLVVLAASLLPNISQLAALMQEFSWQGVVLVSAVSVMTIVLLLSIVLPLISRFGMTKAVRFIPVVFAFLVAGSGSLVNDDLLLFLTEFSAWIQTPFGVVSFSAIALAGSLAVYALSCALSIRIYAKRQF